LGVSETTKGPVARRALFLKPFSKGRKRVLEINSKTSKTSDLKFFKKTLGRFEEKCRAGV
jgi:hypothetical protein